MLVKVLSHAGYPTKAELRATLHGYKDLKTSPHSWRPHLCKVSLPRETSKFLQLAVSSTLLINWYFSIHVTSTSEHTLCNNSTVIISTIPFFNQYNNVNMLSNGISIYPYMFYSLSYAQLHAYQELADFFVCHLMHLHFVIRTCRKGQSRACHRVIFITLVTYLQSQFSLEERAWLGVKQQNNLW